MTLLLTREILVGAYEYLRSTPPFRAWNLPEPEDVRFIVARHPRLFGWHVKEGQRHTIAISRRTVGYTQTLMESMAHEMIHLHEDRACTKVRGEHTAAFRKWADQVCKIHGFDPKRF